MPGASLPSSCRARSLRSAGAPPASQFPHRKGAPAGIGEAHAGERRLRRVPVGEIHPFGIRRFEPVGEQRRVLALDRRDMAVEPVLERADGGEGHERGDACHAGRAVGQAVRLPVVHHLQPVLHAALEGVCRAKVRRRAGFDMPCRDERLQRLQRAAPAQARIAAAPKKLLRLHEEFDLTDAAAAELDIVPFQAGPACAARGVDLLLDRPDVLRRSEVQMAAPDEGLQRFEERLPCLDIAGDGPRLNHRRPLPVAPGIAVIMLGGAHRHGRRGGARIGAEAKVGAEHIALRRLLPDDPHQALRQPREGRLYAAPAGVGRAVLVVEQDQVDIARIVELGGAELAHTEREQARAALRLVRVRQRQFARLVQAAKQMPAGRAQRNLRELGECARHLLQRPDACNVGQRDGERHAPLGPAQAEHDVGRGFLGEARAVGRLVVSRPVGGVRPRLHGQPGEFGIGNQAVAQIGAVGEHRGEEPLRARIAGRRQHEGTQRRIARLIRRFAPAPPAGVRRLGIGHHRQLRAAVDPLSRQTRHPEPPCV